MRTLFSHILLLLAVISYGQQNMILNGNFESVPSNVTSCTVVDPLAVDPTNGLTGLAAWHFNDGVNNWEVAKHNNDGSDISSDEIGEQFLVDRAQCTTSGSAFNNNVHSCGSFPSITFTGTKFAILAATYMHCGTGIHPFKRTHGAIGVALYNGSVFDNGKTYIIRYKIVAMGGNSLSSGDPFCAAHSNGGLLCHIRFFLSENTPPTWNDNSSDQQELYSVNYQEQKTTISGTDLTPCAWKQVEREFTVNQGNYTSLIIYCESGGAAIDDVEVFEKCETTKTIQNKVYPLATGAYAGMGFNVNEQAGTDLLAGNSVNSNMAAGDVVVAGGSKANFTAPNSIALLPGFSAQTNSTFAAVILGCPNSLSRLASGSTNENPDPDYVPAPPMKRNQELAAEKKIPKKMSERAIIFPNPAQNSISYKANEISQNSRFVIVNIMNQVMMEHTVAEAANEIKFDLSGLSQGIYFLNRYDVSGSLMSSNKIVKE